MFIQSRPAARDVRPTARRRGVLAAELAILLPTLGLFVVIIVDFSRVFYFYLTITNCALNGAVYASGAVDPSITSATTATSTNITTFANYDAANLSGKLKVLVGSVQSDSNGSYVNVTVTYQFNTIVDFLGLTPAVNLQRVIQTRIVQPYPDKKAS